MGSAIEVIASPDQKEKRAMNSSTFDIAYSDHVRNVRCSAQSAASLAARLVLAAPPDLSPEQRAVLAAVGLRAEEVAAVQSERDRLGPARLRPVLSLYGNGWGAFHEALLAATRVPTDVSDRGARALAIADSLFPDGITFVQFESDAAWAEGKRRVDRVHKEGMKATIDELIGADYFAAAESVTAKLAEAIGTGRSAHVTPSSTALQEALGRFGRAVSYYARWLVHTCNEDDPASVERYLRAVAPIDQHRDAMRANGGDSGSDDEKGDDKGEPIKPGTPGPSTPTAASPHPAPSPFISAE
jgi:hypothetical protein